MNGVLPAIMNHPDGKTIIAIGSIFLVLAIVEIAFRKRPFTSWFNRFATWVGRLLVIAVGLLMISAGMFWLGLPSLWS